MLLVYEALMEEDKYNTMDMKARLLSDIMAYETEIRFQKGISDIVCNRSWDKRFKTGEKMTDDDKLTIKLANQDRDTAFACREALKRVFEAEYGSLQDAKYDDVRELIEKTAEEMAHCALVTLGWIKENKEEEHV